VIGYRMKDGTERIGRLPSRCFDKDGYFISRKDELSPGCAVYLHQTAAALFRVEVPIVGPAAKEVVAVDMEWDGDCDIDFKVGEKWLVAGFWFTQQLSEPIRKDEVAALKRMASLPPFDFSKLY
jgi:hypothetical protein